MTGPTPSATTPYYTMFLDQSAHLDWDWIRTFAQNYWYYTDEKGVNDIIASGIKKAQDGGGAGGSYYYTVCEMGFFAASSRSTRTRSPRSRSSATISR